MSSKFSSKSPAESIQVYFDFSNLMTSNTETILTSVWSVAVVSGVDVTPNSILSGVGAISSTMTSHLVSGGVNGVTYLITNTVTTSTSQVLILSGTMDVRISPSGVKIKSRQDLADYALRQLGGGVINIEVSDEQVDDCIDGGIQYFHENHFDGIERDYLIHRVSGSTLTVSDGSIFKKGGVVFSENGKTTATIFSVDGNILTINRQKGFDKFSIGHTVGNSYPHLSTATISNISYGDTDKGYIPAEDNVVGVIKILNISSIMGSADYMFNVQYQIMLSEIQNLTSAGTSYFYGVQNYLGHLDFMMKKEKDFRFNRRMNRLYLDIDWNNDVKVGDIVVAEVYRTVEPEEYTEVYSDIWLRRYVTSSIKKMWGSNLRKYSGMQLPGGITFDGLSIYQEAVSEMTKLEEECISSSAPLTFMVG